MFLLLSSLLIMGLLSNVSFAQTPDFIPEIVNDFFTWLFSTLPEEAKQGTDIFVTYFKIILWILVFAIFYWGAKKVFQDNTRIAATIAIVFSLISVILIPEGVVVFIFTTYSAIITILLGLVPLFIGIYIRKNIPEEHQTMRNLVLGIVGVVAIFVGTFFVTFEESSGSGSAVGEGLYKQLGQYSSFGGFIALIWAVIALFMGFKYGSGGGRDRGRDDEIARERQIERADDIHERLDSMDHDLHERMDRTEDDEIQRLRELSSLIAELRQIQDRINRIR